MRDRSPCLGCKHRSPGCQSRCEIGRKYWARIRETNDRVRAARAAENSADRSAIEGVLRSKARAGR